MFKSACELLKKSLLISSVFLISGVLFEIIAQILSLESMIPIFLAYAGVLAIAIGLTGMVLSLIAIMIPSINRNLQTCKHS